MAGRRKLSLEEAFKQARGVTPHGKNIRISFGYLGESCRETLPYPQTITNIKIAADLLGAIRREISMGTFDYAAHFPSSKKASRFSTTNSCHGNTLGALIERFNDLRSVDLGDSAYGRQKSVLKYFCSFIGDERLVDSLRPEDIANWRKNLIEGEGRYGKCRSARTVNYYQQPVRALLLFAHENNYTKMPLTSTLKKVAVLRKKPNPFSQSELETLQSKCYHDMDKYWLQLGCWTGLRTSELCALAWEDIDLNRGEMTVRRSITNIRNFKAPKTWETRIVTLLPPAIEALKALKAITFMRPAVEIKTLQRDRSVIDERVTFVLNPEITTTTPGASICYAADTLGDKWNRIIKRAGIMFRPQYHMRHTFACWMLTAGGNPEYVAGQLGHTDSTMVHQIYGAWIPENDQKEAERIWQNMDANHPRIAQASNTKI
jgi:integrase